MSESDYDSANEYTSLMDGHVAESRPDDLILDNERRKGRSRSANEEVVFFKKILNLLFTQRILIISIFLLAERFKKLSLKISGKFFIFT